MCPNLNPKPLQSQESAAFTDESAHPSTASTTRSQRVADIDPDTLLSDTQVLRFAFETGCKPARDFCIGIESERFGVHRSSERPLQYEGAGEIQGVFQALQQRFGWHPHSEYPGGPTIALHRNEAAVTLEPAGQFEFSGSPNPTVHAVEQERIAFLEELLAVSNPLGLSWIASGFHPLAHHDDLPWVPKLRYGIMRVYLATRGADALEMMRRTATIQANIDFSSVQDAIRKLRIALRCSAVVSAMFANGPFVEAKRYGGKSRRIHTWLSVDPDRQGLIEKMWDKNAGLDEYIAWALDAPMFMIMRGDKVIKNTGQRFRDFMREGFDGYKAEYHDWTTHLNTLFPEVRLKHTIELRGADAVPSRYAPALPAIWTGLLYDDDALEQADRLSFDWTYEMMMQLRLQVARDGLDTSFQGRRLAHVAEKLFVIASDGLDRRKCLDEQGNNETLYLKELGKLVSRGWCPADEVLDRLRSERPTFDEIIGVMQA